MHRYAYLVCVVSLNFKKSPNVIRLKEFSKKCESFLFVEVIKYDFYTINYANGWIGHILGQRKHMNIYAEYQLSESLGYTRTQSSLELLSAKWRQTISSEIPCYLTRLGVFKSVDQRDSFRF
jgi:hypothetical protein